MKLRYVFSFVVVLSQVFFMQAGDLQPKHKTVGELVEKYLLNKKRLLNQDMNDEEPMSSFVSNKTARIDKIPVSSSSGSSSPKNQITQYDHFIRTHVKQALAEVIANIPGVDKESESIHLKLTPKEIGKQAYQSDEEKVTRRKPYQKLKKSREESKTENQHSSSFSASEDAEYKSDNSIDQILDFAKSLFNQNS
ncbi:MAG: hypothetical protein ACXWL5_01520 [Candidatus Chromulinivorax sp.]